MTKKKILIVDDDENIASLLSLYLTKEFFECRIAEDGETALTINKQFKPDLILLDIMLPGMDGYSVCRELRKDYLTPVIMLSAKTETFDKVLGLELGADDYISKPFDNKEMVARVKAVLRRYENGSNMVSQPEKTDDVESVTCGGLTVNKTNYTVTRDGEMLDMPPKELELLYFLVSHPNQVFTREQLLDRIWGYEYVSETRTVDVHIKRLREKLGEHEEYTIATIWGIGYRFERLNARPGSSENG
ncbi:MAG: response regulator transcription factor [Eubacterium sp.]|nr:response regulator transcription factor [Eubacterium sp.]